MIAFALPWALLGFLSIPFLVFVYMLRTRHKRKIVSSMMLFEKLTSIQHSGRRLTRLQLSLLFLVELLILSLLVVAASGPGVIRSQSNTPLVVIIDDSLSMRAETGGKSSRSRGRAYLSKKMDEHRYSPLHVVIAGNKPKLFLNVARPQLEETLNRRRCYASRSSLSRALMEAKKIAGPETQMLIITDRAPEDEINSKKLLWIAVGRPTANIGIVNAVRSIRQNQNHVLLEVGNFNDQTATTTINLTSQAENRSFSLSLPPMARKRLTFDLGADKSTFVAELPQDALSEDNRVVLLPQPEKMVKTAINLSKPVVRQIIQSAVKATGLSTVVPRDEPSSDLIFGDHLSDGLMDKQSPQTWQVSVLSDPTSALKAYTGPFVVDYTHPLVQGLQLDGTIWGTGTQGSLPGTPIVSIGDIPVLCEEISATGIRHIFIRFSPEASTLHRTPAWPVIFWNLLEWRKDHLPGFSRVNVGIGHPVTFRTDLDQSGYTLYFPDGRALSLRTESGQAVIEPDIPGIYRIEARPSSKEPITKPDTIWQFAANYHAADESDLSSAVSGSWGFWQPEDMTGRKPYPLSWLFLIGALILLLIHGFLTGSPAQESNA